MPWPTTTLLVFVFGRVRWRPRLRDYEATGLTGGASIDVRLMWLPALLGIFSCLIHRTCHPSFSSQAFSVFCTNSSFCWPAFVVTYAYLETTEKIVQYPYLPIRIVRT